MSTEKSWLQNLEEARAKAQKVAHAETTREFVTTPSHYNPGIFIYLALLGVSDAWRVHIESVRTGDKEQVFKIMQDPISTGEGSVSRSPQTLVPV